MNETTRKDKTEISVVIPALNEADAIRDLVERTDLALCDFAIEVIVVDDGSTDGTSDQLKPGKPHWIVLRHDSPGGQSAAIHSGVLAASGELVVTLDGDGQNPPEEIPKLLAVWTDRRTDPKLGLIAGQRVGRNDKELGISEEEVVNKIMLGETVDQEFTTVEDVAEIAHVFAAFPTNALTGQSMIVSHGWFME